MGRKDILKNLVDIVVMLKADDDRAKKDQRNLERLRKLDELYGTNDAEEVEGLMGVRDAPDKVSQVRELGRIGELDSGEAKEIEGLMGVREAGKSSSQQPPSDAGQGSRAYTGTFSDDDRESLKQGHAYNRKTGKRLIREGAKFHPVTGEPVKFSQSGGPRNPNAPPPGQASQGTSPVPPKLGEDYKPTASPAPITPSAVPKASELPKNAQGQVVGISADDPKWSAPPKPTPSAQPSTPPASPTPTESSSPTTPPKKDFPGTPRA